MQTAEPVVISHRFVFAIHSTFCLAVMPNHSIYESQGRASAYEISLQSERLKSSIYPLIYQSFVPNSNRLLMTDD
jgi:hypothetical protein